MYTHLSYSFLPFNFIDPNNKKEMNDSRNTHSLNHSINIHGGNYKQQLNKTFKQQIGIYTGA